MTRHPRRRQALRTGSVRPKRVYTTGLTVPGSRRHRARFHVIIGLILLTLAAALVPTHLAEHAGVIRLMPRNWEDLLIGFPTAALLGLAGFIALIWRDNL